MSKTNKNLTKYIGYKFFKENEDGSFELIRIIDIDDFNDKIKIKNIEDGSTKTIPYKTLTGYTPLEPYGFMIFSKVSIKSEEETLHDVIVSMYKHLDVKLNINEPYAICRQSITDFFYTIISNDPSQEIVGVSCSRDNCPTNIPYEIMGSCDEVLKCTFVNLYITDTINDILECIDTKSFDTTLKKLYDKHMKSVNPLYIPVDNPQKSHMGWCPTLKLLLDENNVITDLDVMRNITAVDFDLSKELVKVSNNSGVEIDSLNNEALQFINYTFRINAVNTMVLEYNVDIDLADFNNMNYILLRDNTDKTYIVSYTVDGEYIQKDLEEENSKLGAGDKLRLAFYNKYADKN